MDRRLRSGGQQWTEREAREALAELQDRGESVAAFAQRRGMSVQRVYYWRRRLRETAAPAFVAMPLTRTATDPDGRWLDIEIPPFCPATTTSRRASQPSKRRSSIACSPGGGVN